MSNGFIQYANNVLQLQVSQKCSLATYVIVSETKGTEGHVFTSRGGGQEVILYPKVSVAPEKRTHHRVL